MPEYLSLTQELIDELHTYLNREFTMEVITPQDINMDKFGKLKGKEANKMVSCIVLWNAKIDKLEGLTQEQVEEAATKFHIDLMIHFSKSSGYLVEENGKLVVTDVGNAEILASFATKKHMRSMLYRMMVMGWYRNGISDKAEQNKALLKLIEEWKPTGLTALEITTEFTEELNLLIKETGEKLNE